VSLVSGTSPIGWKKTGGHYFLSVMAEDLLFTANDIEQIEAYNTEIHNAFDALQDFEIPDSLMDSIESIFEISIGVFADLRRE
jgi:hypothetical protein